ncbi:hypothetical protein DXG01_016501 [Tephrocybe rancida]|nr:hypothetical protein DXG01_016501 [Tephrocybe rancida]
MSLTFSLRPNDERGHRELGWLRTFHTFTFATYLAHLKEHEGYGPVRVINEDRVSSGKGFGTHSHSEFEIFSYVVSGELEHHDSMGNTEVLKRGDIQMTSAGTGITHSEMAHGPTEVHFLQIWALPHTAGLTPQYFTRNFSDEEKKNQWVRIVAPVGDEDVLETHGGTGPTPIHTKLTLYATLVDRGQKLRQSLSGSKGFVQVVQRTGYNVGKAVGSVVRIGGKGGEELELREGDSAYIAVNDRGATFELENVGESTAEPVLSATVLFHYEIWPDLDLGDIPEFDGARENAQGYEVWKVKGSAVEQKEDR